MYLTVKTYDRLTEQGGKKRPTAITRVQPKPSNQKSFYTKLKTGQVSEALRKAGCCRVAKKNTEILRRAQ